MKQLNVLVFPCGSEVGLEIYRSLRFAKEVRLFGGSSVADHGKFTYRNYIEGIPHVTEPEFLARINEVIRTNNIDMILPAHDDVVLWLADYQQQKKLACPVATSPLNTCQIARSKKKTMEFFKGTIRTPHLYANVDQVTRFPVFLKPDIGQGSKGTVLAKSKEEVVFYVSQNPGLLIFEYLPGEEYTVDCYTNKMGQLIFCGGRERRRVSGGISVNTKPIYEPEIEHIAREINDRLSFRGMWFFQVKKTESGELALMEVASRVAGTMGMYRCLGINFALMNIYEMQGYDVSAITNDFEIETDRALFSKFKTNIEYESVYIDFDDCIIVNGKLNLLAVAFIYQCINNNIEVHLLTRHAGDLDNELSKHRINNIFNSVIHLKCGEKKSGSITNKKSIFIDDSFSERRDVFTSLGIPVFAPDAVESLIEGGDFCGGD